MMNGSRTTVVGMGALVSLAMVSLAIVFLSGEPAWAQPTQVESVVEREHNFREEWAFTNGKSLYVWAYPMVNMHNRRSVYVCAHTMLNLHYRRTTFVSTAMSRRPTSLAFPGSPINRLMMQTDYIEPQQRFIVCPNQDVTYGIGFADLEKSPVVFQVPDFGSRYWSFELLDQRSDVFGSPGKRLHSKPGHYLIVGPDWNGDVPEGIVDVYQSSTKHAVVLPRVFMDDTADDREAIQPLLNQIVAYPIREYTGEMKTVIWKTVRQFPNIRRKAEYQWVRPAAFWDQLPTVLDDVPPMEGEEAIYVLARKLLEMAKHDPTIKAVLKRSAFAAEELIVQPMFQFRNVGESFGNGWSGAVNGAKFGMDYFNRTAVAKSYMLVNLPEDALYLAADDDGQRRQLDGVYDYTLTFPPGELPPVNGFWSLTVYDRFHFFAPNSMNRFSLGTKNKGLKKNSDGSLTIYLQHRSPGEGRESNWLPVPEDQFGLMLRLYLAEQSVLDKTWKTPAVVRVDRALVHATNPMKSSKPLAVSNAFDVDSQLSSVVDDEESQPMPASSPSN